MRKSCGRCCTSSWVGLSDQLDYFFLGALASLGYWISTRILLVFKVKVLGGFLQPMVG
jgi:hypothetical protein